MKKLNLVIVTLLFVSNNAFAASYECGELLRTLTETNQIVGQFDGLKKGMEVVIQTVQEVFTLSTSDIRKLNRSLDRMTNTIADKKGATESKVKEFERKFVTQCLK